LVGEARGSWNLMPEGEEVLVQPTYLIDGVTAVDSEEGALQARESLKRKQAAARHGEAG